MDVLHGRGQASAAEVQAALPDAPGYSAVRALLRILEDKGHVRHRRQEGRYIYLPRVSRAAASRAALRRVVATFFQGSVAQAVASLLSGAETRISEEDLEKLRDIIEQARKEGR